MGEPAMTTNFFRFPSDSRYLRNPRCLLSVFSEHWKNGSPPVTPQSDEGLEAENDAKKRLQETILAVFPSQLVATQQNPWSDHERRRRAYPPKAGRAVRLQTAVINGLRERE